MKELSVTYRPDGNRRVPVLCGLNLTLGKGEALGVHGQSGGGKTTLARAILRLLKPAHTQIRGTILFRGENILATPEARLRQIRGGLVSLVPQEPSLALNPVRNIEVQIAEVPYAHRAMSWGDARREARSCLETLFGDDAGRVAQCYPHQLSGGQRQRAVIAQAVCCSPELLIADEPTSTLDSVTQYDVLQLLLRMREQTGMSVLFFSHNRAALSFLTDRVLELRDGRLVD